MTVTEVGCMGVKPGLDIMDETTPEGQVLTGVWKAVTAAPGGPHRVYWGLEIEDPTKVWAFFDWDSVEDHKKFAKSFGEEAVKDLPTILTHGEFSKHVATTPFPPSALQAPVTEILLVYFPSDISTAAKDSVESNIKQFIDKALTGYPEIKGVNYGWGVENDFPVRGGEEGQTGSILMAFVGWTSIDAHLKYQETDLYKENVHLLQSFEGVVGMKMIHINCQNLGRKTE